jgi:hypothetical protein
MNEYQQAFEELQAKHTFKGMQWFGDRKELVEEYSWAVPNESVLLYLSEFEQLVEVGAGSGYWAHCIEENGGSVEAIEPEPPEETYVELEQRLVDSSELTGEAVLMVWPSVNQPLAKDVVEQDPTHILYVGETRGGCTASDEFFDALEGRYGLVAKIDLPSFAGVNDDFFHYVRKI